MSINWSQLDGDITRLYVSEDKSLENTLQYLHNKYKVKITPRQFKRKYSGLKKLRATEWKAIIREIAERETENKRSEVFFNGRKLDPARIEREKRRYGNTREAVDNRENIDLGIDTISKHRIEVRTPQPFTPGVSSAEPHLAWPSEQRVSTSQQADPVDQLELSDQSLLQCDLELVDLSTPRLQLNYAASSSGAVSQATVENQTLISSNHFAFNLQSDTIAAMGIGLTQQTPFQWFQRTQSQFCLSSWRSSMHTLQYSYPPQETDHPLSFLGSPGAIQMIANLHSSGVLLGTELETICEHITFRHEHFRPPKFCTPISSYLNCIGTSFRIPPQVLLLTEGILSNWDIVSLSNNREINCLIRSHGRQLLHLLFTVIVHLCCNNMMVTYGFFSFFDWLNRIDLLGQFGIFLQGDSSATHAIVDELVRRLHGHTGEKIRISYEPEGEIDTENHIALLLGPKIIQLPRRMAGRLLHAIASTSWARLGKILVDKGADLNFERPLTDAYNWLRPEGVKSCPVTPLCKAVVATQLVMVKFLIDSGCDVNRQFHDELNGKPYNALGLCLFPNRPDVGIAELLVSAGCEIALGFKPTYEQMRESPEKFQRMPQCLQSMLNIPSQFWDHQNLCEGAVEAAASGNQELSTYLLEHEIFEEALEDILRLSAKIGSDAAVQTLLRRGVNPNAPKQLLENRFLGGDEGLKESTPIKLAASMENYKIVYLLYKAGAKFDMEIWGEIKRNIEDDPADRNDCLSLLSALMVSKVDPALIGTFALTIAVEEKDLVTCGFLLDLGAPIDAYGARGQTALQRATSRKDFAIVQFLHDQGADINVPAYRYHGRTALQAAAENFDTDSDDILECLLNAGADVRAPPAAEGGLTALEALANREESFQDYFHESILRDQLSLFKRFLSLGAPINRPSGVSSNILHGLINLGNHECLEFALQAGARAEDRSLPESQKPETHGRARYMTPLQFAAHMVDAKAIHILLKHGADVNAESGEEFGRTALQAVVSKAPRKAVTEVVDLLLFHGADVNAPPARKGGITALQGAVSTCDFQLVKTLLAHGADVNAPGAAEEGRTALEIAAEWGRLDMVRFLLSKGAVPDPVRGYTRAIELAEDNESFVVAEFLRSYESTLNPLDPGLWNMDFSETFQSMPTPSSDFLDVLMKEYTEI